MESHSSLAVRSGTTIAARSRSCGQDHAVSRTSPGVPQVPDRQILLGMAPAQRATHSSTDHQPAHRRRTMRCKRQVALQQVPPRQERRMLPDICGQHKMCGFRQASFSSSVSCFLKCPSLEFEVPLIELVSDRTHARYRLSVTAVKRQRRGHTPACNTAHAGHLWHLQRLQRAGSACSKDHKPIQGVHRWRRVSHPTH